MAEEYLKIATSEEVWLAIINNPNWKNICGQQKAALLRFFSIGKQQGGGFLGVDPKQLDYKNTSDLNALMDSICFGCVIPIPKIDRGSFVVVFAGSELGTGVVAKHDKPYEFKNSDELFYKDSGYEYVLIVDCESEYGTIRRMVRLRHPHIPQDSQETPTLH